LYCPSGWKYINDGPDSSWSKSLSDYLAHIESRYVLLLLDDFILMSEPDLAYLQKAMSFVESKDTAMLRLTPNPAGDIYVDEFFTRLDMKAKPIYATSLQAAIWNVDFLKKLLSYDFNPWEFEVMGGKTKEAIAADGRLFVASGPVLTYTHFVEKGKLHPLIKRVMQNEGVVFDISTRKFLSPYEMLKYKISYYKGKLSSILPKKFYTKLRSVFGKNEL
jgi:hypothetical protein